MRTYTVAYDIITPESAEDGEVAESGIIDTLLTLRDAVKEVFTTRTNEVDGIYSFDYSDHITKHFAVFNGTEFRTGANERRAIFPDFPVTTTSWNRLVRLLKNH